MDKLSVKACTSDDRKVEVREFALSIEARFKELEKLGVRKDGRC